LIEHLTEHPLIASATTGVDGAQFSDMADFYYPRRTLILSDQQLAWLAEDAAAVERKALAELFSPFGVAASSLASDPFFLFPGSMQALQSTSSSLQLDDTYLWARKDGRDYIFVMAKVLSPSLSIGEQEDLARHVNTTIDKALAARPDIHFLKTGFSFYAHAATQSAKGEVSTIGVGSLIGLLILVISTFRSLRPLSLIVVSILAGCLVALAVTLSVFGFVHLFTLVFGASLIGVSVDYSFHYVADDAFGGQDWTPRSGLRNIFMGITLGLLTSVLAYLALTVAPFPGLQQLAVFSSAGLIGAYCTLICMCRLWRGRFVVRDSSLILRFARGFLRVWQQSRPHYHYMLGALLIVVIALTWRSIEVNDDVRVLQSQPPELVQQEAEIQALLGVAQAGTFLLSSAPSDEELLQLEEALRQELDDMIDAGSLAGYQAVSRWVPSQHRQARSRDAYSALVRSRLPAYFRSLGVDEEGLLDTSADLTGPSRGLDVTTWLKHPVSEPFRKLWLDAPEQKSASIILLFGAQSIDELEAVVADYPAATVINKGRELSTLFGQYRTRVAQLLVLAYLIILAGLSARYGPMRAVVLLVPPIFAGLLALIVISLAGETLNLFNFLAMILVLGIGIDFTLFVAEARGELTSTMFAITLSALTTMLSFGLLSLSSTYAVHSFGLTVLIGIACAYLLSPLALGARVRRERS
ncbi:MAG: MMPL family transporter, partial [Gammaproteobacteria bacterium]|nr:MMPL family transporter [Gammaproteobacteria bacterium]